MLTIVSIKARVLSGSELGEAIRKARKEQGLTQIELAQHARLSRGVIQKIETGRGDLNLATVLRLLQILSLDLTVASRGASSPGLFRQEGPGG